MQGLTEGRIVHFVLDNGPHVGEHRPALVVKVPRFAEEGLVNVQVFIDGTNDGYPAYYGILWRTSIPFDASGETPGSWHWIEHA